MHRYLRYALVGAATGMRTTAGPLVAAWSQRGNPPRGRGIAFVGELVCDKMPFVGSRVKPGPLLGRASAAGYAAATLKDEADEPKLVPISIAALCAVGAAVAVNRTRAAIAQRTRIPDAILGAAEDALCIACMFAVIAG